MSRLEIFSDEKYKKCIELAQNSKSETERYGAILINTNGDLIGEGFNRAIYHFSLPNGRLDRILKQGYANHAEVEAMDVVLQKHLELIGSRVFVAGYFPKDNSLFLHSEFTCDRCAKVLEEFGVKSVSVPSMDGWVEIAVPEAKLVAKNYCLGPKHENRINSVQGRYRLDDILK